MKFTATPLKGSYEIGLEPRQDDRGWFARFFDRQAFQEMGLNGDWVQMNHSFTKSRGSVRGLHFQHPPFDETKLVRCVAGAVQDIIVDLREGSPSFLKYFSTELSAGNRKMLYIPAGCAHGFQTLRDDTQLIYLHNTVYQPASEGGIRYDDPLVGITLPLPVNDISDRDRNHPLLDKYFKGIKPTSI